MTVILSLLAVIVGVPLIMIVALIVEGVVFLGFVGFVVGLLDIYEFFENKYLIKQGKE